ncbi:EAL domain-containing protein [Fusibacter ferrireducens]|uniref:EAL domain-containing protein n=1 Tax=Fusibacter ferrireducens TaxID=2785058 RepID=A0ABR9ZWW7_9FIRM|nr:EAL domain-containing protein [Fusibacter ferrireducens]MBF4694946.1 EAL domain-containing protein [Fusibacter ferrireducens]
MYKKNFSTIRDANILKRYLIYLLPIIILFNIGFSLVYQNEINILEHKFQSKQYEEVGILSFILSTYFDQIHEDLNIIYHSNEFQDYMASTTDQSLEEVILMFERFMHSKPDYVQLRYIDLSGQEIARVDQIEGHVIAIKDLQDKSERYYFKSAAQLAEDQMYISNFDLNVEHGVIVFPYQPVIRFAIPVIRDKLNNGILIINIDGKQFLSILDHYQKKDSRIISTGIFDNQNFWWFSSADAFNIDLTLTDLKTLYEGTFYEKVLAKRSGEFNFQDTNYTISYIKSVTNKDYVFEENYPFGLLSSYSVSDAIKSSENIVLTNGWMRYLMNLILAFIVWQATLYLYNKESEQLMIFASGYISLFTYDGVVITDHMGKLIFCNHVYESTLDYTMAELKQQSDRVVFFKNIEAKINAENAMWEGYVWDEAKNGTQIFKYLRVKAVQNKYKKILYYVGIFSEPKLDTSQVLIENQFWRKHQYIRDEHFTFESVMADFYSKTSRMAVLAIQLSDLRTDERTIHSMDISSISKLLNEQLDNYFHEKYKITFLTEDLIILAVSISYQENAVTELMRRVDTSFDVLKMSDNSVSYFAGIALSPEHGEAISTLFNNALISLRALNQIKRARYLVFDSHLFEMVNREIQIYGDIGKAFRDSDFHVVYQVQKRLDTNKNTGVEALIRWHNNKLGYLLPKEFIPIIEASEYVKSIAKYVIKEVIDHYAPLKPYLPEGFRISINLTEPEFMDKEVIHELLNIIQAGDLEGNYFCFEITESILIESLNQTNEIIDLLHSNGVIVAIDDFGTGYSSLRYLKALKADKLKIDKAFIQDYPQNDNGAMLKAIVRMTEELEIDTVIEGIETQEQYEFCRLNAQHEYQGYYGSKPVAISEISKMFSMSK